MTLNYSFVFAQNPYLGVSVTIFFFVVCIKASFSILTHLQNFFLTKGSTTSLIEKDAY